MPTMACVTDAKNISTRDGVWSVSEVQIDSRADQGLLLKSIIVTYKMLLKNMLFKIVSSMGQGENRSLVGIESQFRKR